MCDNIKFQLYLEGLEKAELIHELEVCESNLFETTENIKKAVQKPAIHYYLSEYLTLVAHFVAIMTEIKSRGIKHDLL